MKEQHEMALEEILSALVQLLKRQHAGKLLLTKNDVLRVLNMSRNTAKKFRIFERPDFPQPVIVGRSKDGKPKYMYRYADVVQFVEGLSHQDVMEREYDRVMRKLFGNP